MNRLKKAVAVVLAAALMVPSTGVFAAASPSKTSIEGKKASVTTTYTGKDQALTITVDGKTLTEGKDFVLVGTEPVDAGTYTLTVKGMGLYDGTMTVAYTINKAPKAASVAKAKEVKKVYKASKIKKTKKIKLGVVSDGKVTYKVKSKSNKIKVTKNGVVKLKKGIKKGTYKIVIKVKATKNYAGGKKVIKIKVK